MNKTVWNIGKIKISFVGIILGSDTELDRARRIIGISRAESYSERLVDFRGHGAACDLSAPRSPWRGERYTTCRSALVVICNTLEKHVSPARE
jgi:hypothetical protein